MRDRRGLEQPSGLIETLLLRAAIYKLLGKVYYEEPGPFLVGYLLNDDPLATLPWEANADMEKGRELLATWRRETGGRLDEKVLEQLAWDYNRLFVGPYRLPAPPWESVYRTEDRLTFGPQTVEVRRAYAAAGLQSERLGREPDDHIGLELEFMHHLSRLCGEALEQGRLQEVALLVGKQCDFLREHLLQWAPAFCADVARSAETAFFRGVARFTAGYLALDAEALRALQLDAEGRA